MPVKEHQIDQGRVIGAAHAIGPALVARGHMVEHVHRHGHNAPRLGVDQAGAIAPVHHTHRQIEHKVHHLGAGHARDKLFHLRAHARKRPRFGEIV